jgi:hypothetical protein
MASKPKPEYPYIVINGNMDGSVAPFEDLPEARAYAKEQAIEEGVPYLIYEANTMIGKKVVAEEIWERASARDAK